jgi:hypothetical protein
VIEAIGRHKGMSGTTGQNPSGDQHEPTPIRPRRSGDEQKRKPTAEGETHLAKPPARPMKTDGRRRRANIKPSAKVSDLDRQFRRRAG